MTSPRTTAVGPARSALLLAAFALGPVAASAQVVQGHLIETGREGRPITLGMVALLDSTLTPVAQTLTDHRGTFLLRAPGPGDYYILGDRLGYAPKVDGILELGVDGWMTVEFRLRPRPVELEGLVASARRERVSAFLEYEGFYQRQKMGIGSFLSPDDIASRPAYDEADLLMRAPFVRRSDGLMGTSVYVAGRGQGWCQPAIYVDDSMVPAGTSIDHAVNVEDILAAEVYRGMSEIPARYSHFQTCGVILIWTHWGALRHGG